MASFNALSRMTYLHKSAHLLALSSPSVAAFLESKCDNLARSAEIAIPDARHQEICGACGNILVIGSSSSLKADYGRNQRQKFVNATASSNNRHGTVKRMSLECSRCSRKVFIHPKPFCSPGKGQSAKPKQTRHLAPVQKTASGSTSDDVLASAVGTTTHHEAARSRKHRAKARKHGSLQAMLVKSKAEVNRTDTGRDFGLDLMDLMKMD